MSDIKFDIALDQDNINFPHKDSASYVDEEGLLPGAHEAHETNGILPNLSTPATEIQFDPINTQLYLTQLALTCKGMPLHYELAHNNHLLIATAGTTNIAVFTAYLDPDGSYSFTLHNPLDRGAPPNLIGDWATQGLNSGSSKTSFHQDINTQPQEPYLLSFHLQPNLNATTLLKETQIYWGDKLIYTLLPNQMESKNYTFSVEGLSNQSTTKLQFISDGIQEQFDHLIQNVSVTSAAQHKLPIPFCYHVLDADGHLSHEQFTVNVTTTPPIEINNKEPVDVIYDQGVYQTIIVQNEDHPMSLTTINIDNLFNNLSISAENRMVEVIQREENGQGTNVYEVQIFDKNQPTMPITIADVQLSFPGGDGGLPVFHRHVVIEEGGGGIILPPQDQSFV